MTTLPTSPATTRSFVRFCGPQIAADCGRWPDFRAANTVFPPVRSQGNCPCPRLSRQPPQLALQQKLPVRTTDETEAGLRSDGCPPATVQRGNVAAAFLRLGCQKWPLPALRALRTGQRRSLGLGRRGRRLRARGKVLGEESVVIRSARADWPSPCNGHALEPYDAIGQTNRLASFSVQARGITSSSRR